MILKKIKDDSIEEIRKDLISNVIGVNKHLKNVVSDMDFEQLICNCHPIDREDFQNRFNQLKKGEKNDTKSSKIN